MLDKSVFSGSWHIIQEKMKDEKGKEQHLVSHLLDLIKTLNTPPKAVYCSPTERKELIQFIIQLSVLRLTNLLSSSSLGIESKAEVQSRKTQRIYFLTFSKLNTAL